MDIQNPHLWHLYGNNYFGKSLMKLREEFLKDDLRNRVKNLGQKNENSSNTDSNSSSVLNLTIENLHSDLYDMGIEFRNQNLTAMRAGISHPWA